MQDRILKCKDCGHDFTFTAGEQEFYAQKGFENDPARCNACRQVRKRDRGATSNTQFRPQSAQRSSYRPGSGRSDY